MDGWTIVIAYSFFLQDLMKYNIPTFLKLDNLAPPYFPIPISFLLKPLKQKKSCFNKYKKNSLFKSFSKNLEMW